MSIYITQFLVVIVAHLLAVVSPGPDFVVVSKNSLIHSRKIGIYTALGVALGLSVHIFYSLAGIGLLISQSIMLFNIIKIIGAFYLLYIGYSALKSQPTSEYETQVISEKDIQTMNSANAIKNGFLVNVLNPKATLFFLALFTQVIMPETPIWIKVIYGGEMILMTFIWFSIVSFLFSHNSFRDRIFRWRHIIDRITGIVLITLGIKVLVSNK